MKKRTAAALFAVLAVILSGCEKPPTPGQTVSAALDAVKALDRDTAVQLIDYDRLMDYSEGDNVSCSDETTKLLVANLSYKIVSEEETGDAATVRAEITNLDLKPIFERYVTEAVGLIFADISSRYSEESAEELRGRLQAAFIGLIQTQSALTTTTVDIALTKVKDGWAVTYDEALQNAVFGGLSDVISNMLKDSSKPGLESGAPQAGS